MIDPAVGNERSDEEQQKVSSLLHNLFPPFQRLISPFPRVGRRLDLQFHLRTGRTTILALPPPFSVQTSMPWRVVGRRCWSAARSRVSPPRGAMAAASPVLKSLVRRLRQYTAPSADGDDDMDERGKVFSQTGVPQYATPRVGPPCRADAAVLVCLFERMAGDLRVLLTKRSSKLSTHSGEVSLPGGKVDSEDANASATALREAKEEIGLDPALVTVTTIIEPFLSKHHLRVVPVIGILSDKQAFRPVANADEVETIFDAPLEMFLKDENRRTEEREIRGIKFLIHFFDYKIDNRNFVIWGLTAAILIRAASVVYGRPPDFVDRIRFNALNKI